MEEQQPPQALQESGHPLEHLGNWKVVIGIGVVIAVILVFSFGLSFLQTKMYPAPNTAQTTQQSVSKSVPSVSPPQAFVGQPENTQLSQQHLSNLFSMKYPAGWTESESESLGSIIVTFQSDQLSSSSPKLVVSSLDLTQASYTLSSGADIYRDDGYKETTANVDHLKAVKLAGVFPPPALKNDFPGVMDWEADIYVTKGTNDYAIRYQYPGNKEDKTYEALFSDMLATLQLR